MSSSSIFLFVVLCVLHTLAVHKLGDDLYLWIDQQQLKTFGGYVGDIFVIDDGEVHSYIRDPNFEKSLPTIPSEVNQINFTWISVKKRYYYNFDILRTLDDTVLNPPNISIKTKGRIPKNAKVFSVILPCSGNRSGVASFEVGLQIETKKGRALKGTPIRLKLRKECSPKGLFFTGPDPECDKSCANGGRCNHERVCVCTEGYMGQYCTTSLCFPRCLNGGNCTAPGVCSCPDGFQGRHCEGGICRNACLNGGKCIQKDKCKCPSGYFGNRCEFPKCVIPCMNGGKCKDNNKCKCPAGFSGDHCEIVTHPVCKRPCKHGVCQADRTCLCDPGWSGRWCHRKNRATHRPD